MACGIDNIRIGEDQVPSGRIVSALESAAHIKDVDLAIAKSYEAMPEGTNFEAWDKWFRGFMAPKTTRNISSKDITSAQNNPQAQELVDLLNLANYETSQEYEVGNYAKRVFNRVKQNLLQRGQGLNDQEINVMLKSLKSVLTKDKVRGDMQKLRTQGYKNLREKLGSNDQVGGIMKRVLAVDPESIDPDKTETYIKLLEEFGQRKAVLNLRDVGSILADAQKLLDGLTEEQFIQKQEAAEKEEIPPHLLAATVKAKKINTSALTSKDDVKLAKELSKYTQEEIEALGSDKIKILMAGIDNINNGFLPAKVLDVIIDLRANKSVTPLISAVQKFKGATIDKYYAKFRSLVTKNEVIHEMIRSSPLSTIDRVFGLGGRDIYKNTFEKLSKAYATYQTEAEGIIDHVHRVEDRLNKKYKNPNRITEIKFLMKLYMIQRETEANPDSENMYPAAEWLAKTIEEVNRTKHYDTETRRIMEKIMSDHNGEFTVASLEKALPKDARDAIAELDAINANLVPKLLHTTGTIRGDQTTMYAFHTSHNVVRSDNEYQQYEASRAEQFSSAHPSARSGATHERTTGVKAISLDPFADITQASSELLLDYHMTPVNREVIRTVTRMQEAVKGQGDVQEQAAAAVEHAVKEVLNNMFIGNAGKMGTLPKLLQTAKKIGYRVALSSPVRMVAELTSNLAFALLDTKGRFVHGLRNYGKLAMNKDSISILVNLNSVQTQRLYDGGVENNKYVDKTITVNKREGTKGYSEFVNSVLYARNVLSDALKARQIQSGLILAADKMVTFPDQSISRPLWFGAFAQKFEQLSGSKPDFDKISANDTSYMENNAQFLAEATSEADAASIRAGATNNPASSILKYQSKGQGADFFKELNGYFQTFLMHEFSTAREAVYSLVSDGQMSKGEAGAYLTAVMTRMSLYGILNAYLLNVLFQALGLGDDDDEDYQKMITNDIIGSALSLVLGRNVGGFGKNGINYLIEGANKLIIGEDYDAWEDSLVYSPIGERDLGYGGFSKIVVKLFGGPYSPILKGGEKIFNDFAKAEATKKKKKREEAFSEAWQHTAVQIGAHTGMLPWVRDIEKIVRQWERKQKK